jgi:hypothetical protein
MAIETKTAAERLYFSVAEEVTDGALRAAC